MADISKLKIGGVKYNIKDAAAREAITALGSPMHFIGQATVPITNGSTADPSISGYDFSKAAAGDVVTYNNAEFAWNGSAWIEFGDLGNLGALAYKDSATGSVIVPQTTTESGSVTPAGTVSFGEVAQGSSPDYTPAGSVSTTVSCTPTTSTPALALDPDDSECVVLTAQAYVTGLGTIAASSSFTGVGQAVTFTGAAGTHTHTIQTESKSITVS